MLLAQVRNAHSLAIPRHIHTYMHRSRNVYFLTSTPSSTNTDLFVLFRSLGVIAAYSYFLGVITKYARSHQHSEV
ncbi:hypothetical protein ASPFODRAFT_400300 [Aspergillus luchuensis CBS 106.47]|uniref:Uncharacterized protein n=1 Tax=Aspergillus luchuensis (strain CBS 106.47) TaxID=1137211 RepID=A0A1M3T2S3_ASPLC|nr:hypothetical protein ASPFODRAFT_400300 [Aspergillus luchuensis CBS 106.47]